MAAETAIIVVRNVGLLLRYVSALPLLLLPVAAWYGEWDALNGVLVTSAAFLAAGWSFSFLPSPREPRLREGLLVAAVGWLLVPLGSVFVFVLGEGWRPLDAFFECMSAWTGTGLSVADLPTLSHTALAWRSIMQWVGGLGVIVLTLSILARPGTGAYTLYVSEGREDKLRPSVLSTVRTIWWLYLLFTLGAVGLLLVAGMAPWDALNHALTGIATGGMGLTPASIADYASPSVEAALIVIMLVGSIAFAAHYALIHGRWRDFLRDEQVRALVIVVAVALPLLYVGLTNLPEGVARFRETAFHVVSAVTTTGFQTSTLADWPHAAKIGLAGVMLLGGAAGSTAGGLKLVRGVLLVKGASWKLRRSGLPHFAVTSFRFGGRSLSEDEANEEFAEAAFIGFLWVVTLFLAFLTFITLLPTVPIEDVLFDVASTQANVGLSTGVVNAALPDGAKAALMGLMWAGRLEIMPVLLLIREILPGLRKR